MLCLKTAFLDIHLLNNEVTKTHIKKKNWEDICFQLTRVPVTWVRPLSNVRHSSALNVFKHSRNLLTAMFIAIVAAFTVYSSSSHIGF